MPKGHAFIKWSPEKDTKLLHTIIAIHDIKIDYERVAEAFGVPARCIQTRMGTLRKSARDGITPASGSEQRSCAVRPTIVKQKNKNLKEDCDDGNGSDDKDLTGMQATTPPESPRNMSTSAIILTPVSTKKNDRVMGGRVTKVRASPRKVSKINYRALDDPFVAMKAEADDENIFGTASSGSAEDSCPSDKEFEGVQDEPDIPMDD